MDGVDAAVVEINEKSINVISKYNEPYDDELKQELLFIRDNKISINLDDFARLDHKVGKFFGATALSLSLIHISEPTRRRGISYAVFCLKK